MSGFVWARKVAWCAAVRSRYTVRTSGRYNPYPFLTLALEWGVWSTPHLCLFTPRKEPRYPL